MVKKVSCGFKTTTRKVSIWMAGAAVLLILSQLASTAQAMCVYNQTDITLDVRFECGQFCGNDWTMTSGEHKCRAGTEGDVDAGWVHSFFGIPSPLVGVYVDAHGYAVITLVDRDTVKLCAYEEYGTLTKCQTFDAAKVRK